MAGGHDGVGWVSSLAKLGVVRARSWYRGGRGGSSLSFGWWWFRVLLGLVGDALEWCSAWFSAKPELMLRKDMRKMIVVCASRQQSTLCFIILILFNWLLNVAVASVDIFLASSHSALQKVQNHCNHPGGRR